jgi:hypothetical protein
MINNNVKSHIKNMPNMPNIYINGNNLPQTQKMYIFILFIFVLLLICLFIFNPFNIAKNYFTIITFISIFVGASLIAILLTYGKISSKDSLNNNTVRSLIYRYILNASIFILIMGGLGVLLYYIFKLYGNIQSKHSILALFINLFIVVVFLSLIYRFFDIGTYLKNSPFFQLIYNVIMYIPCLFIYLIETPIHYLIPSSITKNANSSVKDAFNNEYTKTNIGSIVLLIIMILLLLIYMFFPYLTERIQLQGGKQITNQTIYTNNQADLFTMQQLTNMTTPDYQYGLSFWLYIDSEPPSTSNLYLSNGSVLNFAETPNILYNGVKNTLIFTQKYSREYIDTSNVDMNEYLYNRGLTASNRQTTKKGSSYMRDASNNIIHLDKNADKEIFRLENIQLQKWNHIALNLYNGTMDIFYNGQLVKSQPGVVPWIDVSSFLTIGSNNGISGGVCNMTFFNKPLTYTQIYYLYELFKNKTPPITYSNFNKTVVFNPSKNPSNNKKTYTQYGSDSNTTILTQSPAIMQSITNQTTTTTTQNNGNIPTPYVMASPLFTRFFNYVS